MTRSAISPRFAMRTFLNTGPPTPPCGRRGGAARPVSNGLDAEQGLAELHGRGVLGEDLGDLPRDLRLDLVHQLHRLDDAEDLALLHHGADVDERRRLRGRR